ncbi:MAG TPA: hypothetical protein VF084_08260 [Nitrososphaeraceae archaeon]
MKLYQKITLITTILSLIVPLSVIFVYFYIDSLMEIPILGVFLADAVLISVEIIAIKLIGLFIVFCIKNTKVVGLALILCGVILILTIQLWGIPGFVVYIVSGIMALKEKHY